MLAAGAGAEEPAATDFETLAMPFPFYNEAFGFAAGYVYGRAGWPEPQSRVLGTAMAEQPRLRHARSSPGRTCARPGSIGC